MSYVADAVGPRPAAAWLPGGLLAGLIVAGAALRLALAVCLGLGIDESYMVAAGRSLHLGYFDHPPLAWWLAGGMAQLAGSEADWIVRLPFIALFAVSTWLMFRLGATLFGARAGLWAALALNLSPVFTVTTGGWVLPDGPLTCALLAAALCLTHALTERNRAWRWWLGAGAAAGLALLSKYTAILTLAGAFAFLATAPAHRHWLRRPHPYVAALLAAGLFAPVLIWNATHGWVSFAFQGERAAATHWRLFGPLPVLAGEALFVLPWIWLPMMLAAGSALRAGARAWQTWLPLCLGAGPILLFAAVAWWSKHVLYHWAAPGYLMLFPLLGATLVRWERARPRLVRGTAAVTAGLLVTALALMATEVRWNWLPLVAEGFAPGADPDLQLMDWSGLRPALAARGLLDRPDTVIAATGWQEAGKLDYALGGSPPVLCLSSDRREYGMAPGAALRDGEDALIISARPIDAAAIAFQGYGFATMQPLAPIALDHAGQPGLVMHVTLGHRLHGAPP